MAEKTFVGKNILHVGIWRRGDERTTYHLIYVDGESGRSFAKRFNVTAVTRDKEYDLTKGGKNSRVLYLAVHPNGESERVEIHLTPACAARNKIFEFDFESLAIKGRGAAGNIVTRYPVRRISQLEVGRSTLGAQKYWYDEATGRYNKDERGVYLGSFDTGDQLLVLYSTGEYEIQEFDPTGKLEVKDLLYAGKFRPKAAISAVYFEGEKQWTMVKRFLVETSTLGQRFRFISEHKDSRLYGATVAEDPVYEFAYMSQRQKVTETLRPAEFIDVKGWKALGNKLVDKKLIGLKLEAEATEVEEEPAPGSGSKAGKQADLFGGGAEDPASNGRKKGKPGKDTDDGFLHTGDTLEFDV